MRPLAVVCVALLSLIASGVEAQSTCEGGRVADAQGFCCWPGQSFARAEHACVGPPSCPAGLVAQGEDCVGAGTSAATPTAVSVVPVAPVVPVAAAPNAAIAWPEAPPQGPSGMRHARFEQGMDEGLIIGGAVMGGMQIRDLLCVPQLGRRVRALRDAGRAPGRGQRRQCHGRLVIPVERAADQWSDSAPRGACRSHDRARPR